MSKPIVTGAGRSRNIQPNIHLPSISVTSMKNGKNYDSSIAIPAYIVDVTDAFDVVSALYTAANQAAKLTNGKAPGKGVGHNVTPRDNGRTFQIFKLDSTRLIEIKDNPPEKGGGWRIHTPAMVMDLVSCAQVAHVLDQCANVLRDMKKTVPF